MRLTISLAQIAFTLGDVEANFERAVVSVAEAASQGSDIILLPELWASGYDLKNWQRYATAIDEGIFARVAALACQHEIAIGGSLLELHEGCAYNTFVLFGPDGTRWGVYRKIHLFRLLHEEKYLHAGENKLGRYVRWQDKFCVRGPGSYTYYMQDSKERWKHSGSFNSGECKEFFSSLRAPFLWIKMAVYSINRKSGVSKYFCFKRSFPSGETSMGPSFHCMS